MKDCIAVDLDGTLAYHIVGDFDRNIIGDPIPLMMKRVKSWIKNGTKVVIFTARAYNQENIPPIEKWLKAHGIGGLTITCCKTPDIAEIWDDRAVSIKRNTGEIISTTVAENFGLLSDLHHKIMTKEQKTSLFLERRTLHNYWE